MNTFNSTFFSNTILSLGVLLRMAGFFLIMQASGEILLLELVHIPGDFATHPEKLALIPHIQLILVLVQGVGMLLGFVVLPLLYLNYFRSYETPSRLLRAVPRQIWYMTASVILLMVSIPMIEQLSLLNKNMSLPDALHSIEDMMNKTEKSAAALTAILVQYNGPFHFLLVFIVVAIIPAVGEELVFRGIVQNELQHIWNNKHLAIWVSGFIFSFIHFQFFGFLPRMLLGVLFGYCYLWTGSLWVPIAMHFTNNALTLVVSAFYKNSFLNTSESENTLFDIRFFIAYIVAQAVFLFVYYKLIRQQPVTT
ncbi:MAG TPA: CPBP family intramembrane glutamic endopeptidase [Cytophagaceae bacterium]|jgi:membrane protease YdiL (CAAX protease family)|nr:CPBP family intramembrane glutamic endopeptidase [Cytophagaceae bacterium]